MLNRKSGIVLFLIRLESCPCPCSRAPPEIGPDLTCSLGQSVLITEWFLRPSTVEEGNEGANILFGTVDVLFGTVDRESVRNEEGTNLLLLSPLWSALPPSFICQKLFTENRERLVHLLKGITVGTEKFQVTPIPQDVLIVWGDHDQLFPLEKAFAVQRSLNGSARLEVVKKTGHAPQLEDPARFNKLMLDFLLAAHKPDPSV